MHKGSIEGFMELSGLRRQETLYSLGMPVPSSSIMTLHSKYVHSNKVHEKPTTERATTEDKRMHGQYMRLDCINSDRVLPA